MKLQKLILAGAYTVAGDVLIHHPTKHQLKLGEWAGGDDVVLTADGVAFVEEHLTKAPRAKRVVDPAGE